MVINLNRLWDYGNHRDSTYSEVRCSNLERPLLWFQNWMRQPPQGLLQKPRKRCRKNVVQEDGLFSSTYYYSEIIRFFGTVDGN